MPSLDNLLIVVAVAFAAPFLLGLAPGVRIPAVVVEIVAGIVVGPSVLGWVEIDGTLEVMATLGLAFLLFLGGLEVDFAHLRGRVLRLSAGGYALSLAIAVGVALALAAGDLVETPLLVAIALGSTSLGGTAGASRRRSAGSCWPGARSRTSRRSSCCRCSSPARAAPARRSC
jgi:Kef-type K+ transport system membrane component KefB